MHKSFDLIELMRSHFGSSKQLLRCSILCNIGVVAISLLTSIDVFRGANLYIPISLFLVQTGAYVLRQLSIIHFSGAENVRSTAMLKDGLGLDTSDLQLIQLYQTLTRPTVEELPFLLPYYVPHMPPGSESLLQLIAESCTYTRSIALQAFKSLTTVSAVIVLAVVALISLMINAYATHTVLVNVNMFILAFLSLWATLDLTTISMRLRELDFRCSHISSQCNALQTMRVNKLDDIMRLAYEYNCTLAACSPLPTRFYEARKADLDESWPSRSDFDNKI